jgi:fumarate reductase subunit D
MLLLLGASIIVIGVLFTCFHRYVVEDAIRYQRERFGLRMGRFSEVVTHVVYYGLSILFVVIGLIITYSALQQG